MGRKREIEKVKSFKYLGFMFNSKEDYKGPYKGVQL